MKRRALLLALPLAACGLSERPYAERRDWPLIVRRPGAVATPPRDGRVLEVRALRAGPGLETRGLQSLGADGSIATAYYEEWAVPPAEAAEESLRQWLADAGLYAAVTAPGSRADPDLVLEGELLGLWTIPALGQAHAAVAVTAIAERPTRRILLQRRFTAEVPITGQGAAADAHAMTAALAAVFADIEAALRPLRP
jgi:cholesterol transport system auxiliary component